MTYATLAYDGREYHVSIEFVTPEAAQRWLDTANLHNRDTWPSTIERYARAMRMGDWPLTGVGLIFDESGLLLDGQHRLFACVRAGVGFVTVVWRGIAAGARDRVDTGKSRSAPDVMKLNHRDLTKREAGVASAAAKFAMFLPALGFFQERVVSPSPAEVDVFVVNHPEFGVAARKARALAAPIPILTDSLVAMCLVKFAMAADPDTAEEFFAGLGTMDFSYPADPRKALLQRLRAAKDKRERLSPHEVFSATFRTWNAWRGGQGATILRLNHNGNPLPIPQKLAP